MIEMVARDGAPGAMLCPALVCDVCREQVTGEGPAVGIVIYYDRWNGEQRTTTPLYTAHRGRCGRSLAAELEGRYPRAEGWQQLWREAGEVVQQLAHNTSNPFVDDAEGRYQPHTLAVQLPPRQPAGTDRDAGVPPLT